MPDKKRAARKMSEAQAWRAIAEAWREASHDGSKMYVPNWGSGLCPSVGEIEVTDTVRNAMWTRMQQHWPERLAAPHSAYRWTTDEVGRDARVAFCRKMARLATPKSRAKKPARASSGKRRQTRKESR